MADLLIATNGSSEIDNVKAAAIPSGIQPPNVVDLGFTPFASSAETIAALERAELVILQLLNDARK